MSLKILHLIPMGKIIRLPVAKMDEIAPGRTKVFRYGVLSGIAYNDAGTIKAYVNRCAHAGGPLMMGSNGILQCQWHGATFDPHSGERASGQAPEGSALKPIELVEEGGSLYAILELKDEFEF